MCACVSVSVSVSVDWARTLDDSENEWVIAEEHVDAIDEGAIVVVVLVVEQEEEARAAEGRPRAQGKKRSEEIAT